MSEPREFAVARSVIKRLPRPLSISFSGGRTSGLMLRLFLDAFDGALPDDVVCLFANTGKEVPETLDFVQECATRWGVRIVWIEYDPAAEGKYRTVSHNSASRDGEPFEALIEKERRLPSPVVRMCTQRLKVGPMARFSNQHFGTDKTHVAIGIRADEPRRVARVRACGGRLDDWRAKHLPLADAGITRQHVRDFWRSNDFDLRLLMTPPGTSAEGNCDLCFLKGLPTIAGLIREKPERADWWAKQEARVLGVANPRPQVFRIDRPSYAQIAQTVKDQGDLLEHYDLEGMDCACTD